MFEILDIHRVLEVHFEPGIWTQRISVAVSQKF